MKNTKIIIFTYDFYPSDLVSSHRLTFWANNLKKHITSPISLSVITCNKFAQKVQNIDSLSILENTGGKLKNVWQLIRLLRKNKNPSTLIISAGPFYFLLAIFFIPSHIKTIIDLRDPFSDDPKFKVSFIKRSIKRLFQFFFIKKANAIITINNSLKDSFNIQNKKTIIIPNGIDEVLFESPTSDYSSHRAVILGKVYSDISSILNQIKNIIPDFSVDQLVNKDSAEKINLIPSKKFTKILPTIKKDCIPKELTNYEIGIVSSYPKPYVLPVKIFDYIASGLKIIIIDDSKNKDSEIKKLLKNYTNKFFINEETIDKELFIKFINSDKKTFNKDQLDKMYFREESTKILANFLEENF
jgi:hypothetical protein